MKSTGKILVWLWVVGLAGAEVEAQREVQNGSWTQWRGPGRSNLSGETGLLQEWPTGGPPLLWTVSGLGEGIASVSVAGGRLYTVGYRDDGEFLWALDAKSGQKLWARRAGPVVKENSLMRWLSQRTSTLDEDRLYTITARGELFCLRTSDGEEVWRKSYPNDFLSPRPAWGFCDYPLVDGEKLICCPAGPGATIVALKKQTGQILWQTAVPDANAAGYAATIVTDATGIRQYVLFLSKGLVGVAADDGRILWRYHGTAARIASSYTPIARGDFVFSANGYGGGMALLELSRSGEEIVAKEHYHHSFPFDPFQDSTVRVGEYIYAFRSPGSPVCIEMKTGNLAWGPVATNTKGKAALTFADRHLYIRRASGLMVLVEATPEAYREKGSFQIPEPEEAMGVTFPVVANRRLYLRDNSRLLCYNIAKGALAEPRANPQRTILALTEAERGTNAASSQTLPKGRDRVPDAVFVATPQDIVEKMLELAEVKQGDVVYDLGSGDGRIVITAARKYGCKAIGYEIDPALVTLSRKRVVESQVGALVRIEQTDLFTNDLSAADVIAVYLPPELLERLRPQFAKLKPGSRIVSHQFAIPNARPDQTLSAGSNEDGELHRLYLWRTPLTRSRR